MFVSDKLAFVELHKTGGSHIGRWLARTVPGEQIGKHNRLPRELQDRFVIGSVRNPWDWYVSLWAYGCSGRGSVWKQTTDGTSLRYYRHALPSEMGHSPGLARIWRQWQNDRRKDRAGWQDTYADADDPERFRRWLTRVLDPSYSLDLREGYGFSWVPRVAGLMTYRYLKLFTSVGERLYTAAPPEPIQLPALFDELGFIDGFVRMEQLEPELVAAIEAAGVELSAQDRQAILDSGREKTNTSSRRPAAYYYDAATSELVAQREAAIIERHGYAPPAPA